MAHTGRADQHTRAAIKVGNLLSDEASSLNSGQRAVFTSFQRHVQSQPALATREGQRQGQSSHRLGSDERAHNDANLGNMRVNLAGLGNLLGVNERFPTGGDDSHRQVGFSSPAYRLAVDSSNQMPLFSARNPNNSARVACSMLERFAERLYTRDKMGQLQEEL